MTDTVSPFWTFMDELRRDPALRMEPSYRLDLLTVLQRAREKGIPVTLDDVRSFIARQMHEGIIISESFIPEFISAYLRHARHRSVLDPFAGVGGLIGPVAQTLAPERAVALVSRQREADLAQMIHPDATIEWRVRADSDLPAEIPVSFDAVIGCPGLGGPTVTQTLDYQGQTITLRDVPDHIIAAQALQLLSAHGAAIFLLTNGFLWSRRSESLGAQLDRLGVYLDTALLIPRGAFGPVTRLSGLLVILKRERPDRVFVGELSPEAVQNGALLKNLMTRQSGKIPQLGCLVERSTLTSVEAVFAEQQIERQARKMGVPAVSLADIALEVNLGRSHPGGSFVEATNSVYLPLIGRSAAVTSLENLKLKPHNYAQLILDPDKADAHYVADFLNTPLGLLVRQSRQSGDTISHITKTTLARMYLYLPDLTTQARVLGAQARLTNVQTEVERMKRFLAEHPMGVTTVEKDVKRWEQTSDHDAVTWYESLPFPLASILWAYHADTNVEHRVEFLLHFFEALSEYLAAVLLSAYASDDSAYARYCHAWIDDTPEFRDTHKQATFGYWTTLGSRLAKSTRELLNDRQEAQQCLALFCQEDPTLVEVLTKKGLFTVLDEVRDHRNHWKGHGGIANLQEHQRRLGILEQSLATVRHLLSDYHASTWLIAPGMNNFTAGVYHYSVKLLMGTHTTFRTVQLQTLRPMDTEHLYLLREGSARPLQLLPFMRLMTPPATERTACYFYSSLQGSQVRWVSYQFEGEPELLRPDLQVERALRLLSSERTQETAHA